MALLLAFGASSTIDNKSGLTARQEAMQAAAIEVYRIFETEVSWFVELLRL